VAYITSTLRPSLFYIRFVLLDSVFARDWKVNICIG